MNVNAQIAGKPGAATAPLLAVDDVTLQYKTEQHLVTATYRVGFEVREGERFVLLGPSGCGKSTLLKAVAGFMQPVEGEIRLNGKQIKQPGSDRMMVFQEFDQLLPWKTVLGNVLFPQLVNKRMPKDQATEHARAMLAKVNLSRFENVFPHMLSGGMKQRVAIARALAMEPAVLLMDEPFAALDEQTRMTMGHELLRIWSQTAKTVVFVTHSLTEAVYLADEVLVMSARPGRIIDRIAINLPRPRTYEMMATDVFGRLRERIWQQIRKEG
jgi:NitT/TauT family transport system ATP-binding protein